VHAAAGLKTIKTRKLATADIRHLHPVCGAYGPGVPFALVAMAMQHPCPKSAPRAAWWPSWWLAWAWGHPPSKVLRRGVHLSRVRRPEHRLFFAPPRGCFLCLPSEKRMVAATLIYGKSPYLQPPQAAQAVAGINSATQILGSTLWPIHQRRTGTSSRNGAPAPKSPRPPRLPTPAHAPVLPYMQWHQPDNLKA
jgi:hypothetical protein